MKSEPRVERSLVETRHKATVEKSGLGFAITKAVFASTSFTTPRWVVMEKYIT